MPLLESGGFNHSPTPPSKNLSRIQRNTFLVFIKVATILNNPYTNGMELIEKYDENGNKVSPELPKTKINYLIDIDGTICEDVPNEEPERMLTAAIMPGTLERVNAFYDAGNIITFFTSRTEAHRANTEAWLAEHGFKYHGILFGKPRGGNYIIIDDKILGAETKIQID